MKIIERFELDTEKWDALVKKQSGSTFFSLSWYLDATAEQWAVIVDKDFSVGMALPYTVRLGQETLYTPIFVRYLEFFGAPELFEVVLKEVNMRFRNIHMNLALKTEAVEMNREVFQTIDPKKERTVSTHTLRMLKKAAKQAWNVQLSDNENHVLDIVKQELKGKIEGINDRSVHTLGNLLRAAKHAGVLKVFELENRGAIACLVSESHCLYLKGTTNGEAKSLGGMYLLMNTAIEEALAQGKVFDFGGSKSEGVRRFNCALGGRDVHYSVWIADNSPNWFKFAKRIRNTWRKFY